MAWYRQGSQPWQAGGQDPLTNGDQRGVISRVHDHGKAELLQKGFSSLTRTRSWKSRRLPRSGSTNWLAVFIMALLLVGALITFYCADDVFMVVRTLQGSDFFPGLPGSTGEDRLQFFGLKEGNVFGGDHSRQLVREAINPHSEKEKEERASAAAKKTKKKSYQLFCHRILEEVTGLIDPCKCHLLRFQLKAAVFTIVKEVDKFGCVLVSACEIGFAHSVDQTREPRDMSVFQQFLLNYFQTEKKPGRDSRWKPRFAGHQSLVQREESYLAKDQTLHCGFVEGPEGSQETGFEVSKADKDYLQTCQIAVSSCIFGNYDHMRNPTVKKVSLSAKETVCFAMFVDQQSLDGMIEERLVPDANMTVGFWRVVLIKTLPYMDNRRTGKVPKFLTHRLFPNAKYSIWLDSKLRLNSDPLLILDYFLWRGNHEYAISNHYDRHCVWEEVAQNKKLNKFNHSRIDEQFEFYKKDGLKRFNASDPHKLLPSHVPEGSFIVRAHTPMSNLFSCLWFNEVERFTSRDQLSFAYTYLKFVRTNPSRAFRFNMFKDCERREMVKLYHHKPEETGKQ